MDSLKNKEVVNPHKRKYNDSIDENENNVNTGNNSLTSRLSLSWNFFKKSSRDGKRRKLLSGSSDINKNNEQVKVIGNPSKVTPSKSIRSYLPSNIQVINNIKSSIDINPDSAMASEAEGAFNAPPRSSKPVQNIKQVHSSRNRTKGDLLDQIHNLELKLQRQITENHELNRKCNGLSNEVINYEIKISGYRAEISNAKNLNEKLLATYNIVCSDLKESSFVINSHACDAHTSPGPLPTIYDLKRSRKLENNEVKNPTISEEFQIQLMNRLEKYHKFQVKIDDKLQNLEMSDMIVDIASNSRVFHELSEKLIRKNEYCEQVENQLVSKTSNLLAKLNIERIRLHELEIKSKERNEYFAKYLSSASSKLKFMKDNLMDTKKRLDVRTLFLNILMRFTEICFSQYQYREKAKCISILRGLFEIFSSNTSLIRKIDINNISSLPEIEVAVTNILYEIRKQHTQTNIQPTTQKHQHLQQQYKQPKQQQQRQQEQEKEENASHQVLLQQDQFQQESIEQDQQQGV